MVIINSDIYFYRQFYNYATAIQLWLSLKTLKNTSGLGRRTSKIKYISFISTINVITSCISWINTIYSDYIVLKVIYDCNLLRHNTGHPTYMITYPVHDMVFIHDRNLLDPKHWKIRNLSNIQ